MKILVIGTDPPCVRCRRTSELAREVAQQLAPKVEVEHVSLDSEEAGKYGKIGTAHDIADLAKMSFDREKIHELAQVWSKELDSELMPYKDRAEEVGYLMTPVLVINGKVKAMGFVPDKEKIREWIEAELRF